MTTAHTHTPRRRPYPPLRLTQRNNAAMPHSMVQRTILQRNKTTTTMLQCTMMRCNIFMLCDATYCNATWCTHCFTWNNWAIGFTYWLFNGDKYIYCDVVVYCAWLCYYMYSYPDLINPRKYIMIEKILIACAALGVFAIVISEVVRSLWSSSQLHLN